MQYIPQKLSRRRKRDEKRSSRASLKQGVELFASLVTCIVAITTLVSFLYVIRPGLKPKEKLGATITKIVVDRGVLLGEFAAMTGKAQDLSQYESQFPMVGQLVSIQLEISGYETNVYSTYIRMLNEERYDVPEFIAPSVCVSARPKATTDRLVVTCWQGNPGAPGKYIVRAELYDMGEDASAIGSLNSGKSFRQEPLLDVFDSAPFQP